MKYSSHSNLESCGSTDQSNLIERKLGGNVEVLNHIFEFLEADSAIIVEVCLDDGTVDQLLELHIGQVVAHHHLQHCEELAVGDVAVLIDIVDLESKPKLLLLIVAVE